MDLKRISVLALSLALLSPLAHAKTSASPSHYPHSVEAAQFLGTNYMQSDYHRVSSQAIADGYMLRYAIETPYERVIVTGSEEAKIRIHEIQATEALRQRSTGGAILGSAKDRTTNLVKTPYRIGKTLVSRAGEISTVGDAALFIPEQIGQTAGALLNGVGELGVTAVRITKGAAGTKCSGLDCATKAGSDIWSGVNSLAGKHNASRRLHAEFGTDPQTENKAYRKQIDRLAYANSYTGTSIKLGAGQAGIEYLSPAFTGIGYVNNTEFVGKYEDAHRQKNYEKNVLSQWGVSPQTIDRFYRNKTFTKQTRRRFFKALNTLPNKAFAQHLFEDAANSPDRSHANSHLRISEYIADVTKNGDIAHYTFEGFTPLLQTKDGTLLWPIYADYLLLTPQLSDRLQLLASRSNARAIHVLGYVSPEVKHRAKQLSIQVVEWPSRAR